MRYDSIVVGAGFAGATIARELALKGEKVLVIDKRDHIAGNMYDFYDTNGVLIQKYGPHIFHTNDKEVFEYLSSFGEFYPYEHKVVGNIYGKIVPIPFNFTSLETLYPLDEAKKLEEKLCKNYSTKVSIYDLLVSDDTDIKKLGEYIFENVFVHYTKKQWNTDTINIKKEVINRVPVVLSYKDLYFNDSYQFMPKFGFTSLFERMLNHPNITIKLNTSANSILTFDEKKSKVNYLGEPFEGKIFYSGAIDELFSYKFGALPYRSLDLVFEQYNKTFYQNNSVVNYTVSEKFTRITEFKYLTNQVLEGKTTILKEYPKEFDVSDPGKSDPYYPINNELNNSLYEKYAKESQKYKIYLCGRLAEYKYYNMDGVIRRALDIVKNL